MTLIPFQVSQTSAPPFQATMTLDGQSYTGSATWNVTGQRWYFTLTDLNGNVVWSGALVGSPSTADIYLAPGLFTASTVLYREDTGNFEVNP